MTKEEGNADRQLLLAPSSGRTPGSFPSKGSALGRPWGRACIRTGRVVGASLTPDTASDGLEGGTAGRMGQLCSPGSRHPKWVTDKGSQSAGVPAARARMEKQ